MFTWLSEGVHNQAITFGITLGIEGIYFDDLLYYFVIFSKNCLILLKPLLCFIDPVQFRHDLCTPIGQSLFITFCSLVHFIGDLDNPLSIEPKPIIEPVPILYGRLVKKIHVMQCELRKLVEVGEALNFGVEFLLFLGFDDILFIV